MHKKQRNLNKSCRCVLWNTWPMSQEAEASLYRGVNQFSVTCDILMDSWTHTSVCELLRALECLSLRFISLQSFITGGLAAHLSAHTHTEWKSTRGKGPGNTSMKRCKAQAIITWSLILVIFTKICTRTTLCITMLQHITGSHSWFGWNSIEQSFRFHSFCMRIVMFWIKT